MEQTFRLAEIELSRSQEQDRIVGLFRFRDEQKGRRSPELVIMADIASSLYVYEQLLDTLTESAERVFRQLSSSVIEPMARFEKIIKRLNESIAHFVETEPSELHWNRVSLYVFEVHDKALCVSGIGHLSNAFLQKQGEQFKTFDLFGSLDIPPVVDPQKVFQALLCGEMKPGDVFFAGTSNFERWRGEIDLVSKLKQLPPVSAALELTQELERLTHTEDFAGIVISCSAITERAQPQIEPLKLIKPSTASSMETLYKREQSTEKLLSPHLRQSTEEASEEETEPVYQEKKPSSLVALWATVQQQWKERKTSPVTRLGKDATTLAGMHSMGAGHGTLLSQTKVKKGLLSIIAICSLVIAGLLWQGYTKKQQALRAWDQALDQATDKRDRAESASQYGNEQGAKAFLADARRLAQALPDDSPTHKEKRAQLLTSLDAIATKLQRKLNVQPQRIYSAENGVAGSLRAPLLTQDGLTVIDQSARLIVQIDPKQTQNITKTALSTSTSDIVASAAGATKSYFADTSGSLFSYDSSKQTIASAGTLGNDPVTAMTIYNKRLYALHSQSGSITRHDASGTGFGAGTSYIKQTTKPLTNSTSIAIDSSVYVGWNDGTLKRYLSGAEESWTAAIPEPQATSLSMIWTDSSDLDRVIAADPQGKRLLVWRKSDGAFIAQLVSDSFTGPTALTGDGATKKLYVVDGSTLWQVDIP